MTATSDETIVCNLNLKQYQNVFQYNVDALLKKYKQCYISVHSTKGD